VRRDEAWFLSLIGDGGRRVSRGMDGLGMAGLGTAWNGRARQDSDTFHYRRRWREGFLWRVKAGWGGARPVMARSLSVLETVPEGLLEAGLGMAGTGMAGRGVAWHGFFTFYWSLQNAV
jgi:hypothetical protein